MAHMLMLLPYSSLSLLILFFAFKLFLQTITRRKLDLPPSPPSLPILGHLHLIKKPIHRTFHRLSQKYGQVLSIKFLQGLIDKQRGKDEEENTMIDHMLSLQKSQPEYYTDQIIKGLILVSALHLSFDLFFVSVTQVKPVSN